jgi:hypothetical protein
MNIKGEQKILKKKSVSYNKSLFIKKKFSSARGEDIHKFIYVHHLTRKEKNDQKIFGSCQIETHFSTINIISCVLCVYIDILQHLNNCCSYTVPNTA